MADFNVGSFTIPAAQVSSIASDLTKIQIRVYYDTTQTAGWTIVAQGDLGSFTICPKPCGKVS